MPSFFRLVFQLSFRDDERNSSDMSYPPVTLYVSFFPPAWCCQVSFGDDDRSSSRSEDDDEVAAAVSNMRPEMWIKSSGNSKSTTSMSRPGKGDVCTVS